MSSYLQKLRRQSKQLIPQSEPKSDVGKPAVPSKITETPKVETSTAAPNEPPNPTPIPTVVEPSDKLAPEPALHAEDQRFLERLEAIASEPEEPAPALPSRTVEVVDASGQKKLGKDAQEALMDGAHTIALPASPREITVDAGAKGKEKANTSDLGRRKSVMSYFTIPKFGKKDGEKEKDKKKAAADAAKTGELTEAEKEDKELIAVLDQLNLSAVNNRVFSFSKESEDLLNKFTQVLKDLVNGVPTAYGDLEKLFTDYDAQLKKMYGGLPPFLQNLVKSLPAKLTATLAPELLAATAEKPGFDAQAAAGSSTKKSRIPSIPSLKSLIATQGAVSTALKSIVNFLRFRFPALAIGTNVIMSIAVFVLLFVFWYCYKRGREVRLEKERLAASTSSLNEDADSIFGDKEKTARVEDAGVTSPVANASGIDQSGTPAPVQDLPSVSHLPDPRPAQTSAPVPVAESK